MAGDTEGLHRELARLRTALVLHLHGEADQVDDLPHAAATVTREGQQRLVGLVDELLAGVQGDCNCLLRAAEVEFAVGRQARLETKLFDRSRARSSDRR